MATGNLYQRPDGKWGYRLNLTVNGKRKQPSRSGWRLKSDAQDALNVRLAELAQGIGANPSDATVAQHMARWLTLKANVKPATIHNYAGTVALYVDPHIGKIKLTRLTYQDVEACYAATAAVAPSQVKLVRTVLGQALDLALKQGLVSRNVARLAQAPRWGPQTAGVWSDDEVRRFLETVSRTPHAVFFRLLLASGARRGEAEALRWSDLEGSWLTISRTITNDAQGRRTMGESPKSKNSRRRIQLDEGTLSMLKAHRVRQTAARLAAPQWQDNNLIFPSRRGRIVPVGFCNDELDKLCAAADVPRLTMHGLRHTYITHALLRGESPHVVAARVGHTVAMLFKVYAHVIESQQEAAAQSAGQWLDEVG